MWEIWATYLLSQALKSCPRSNKLPNLVTLVASNTNSNNMLLGIYFNLYETGAPNIVFFRTQMLYPNISILQLPHAELWHTD